MALDIKRPVTGGFHVVVEAEMLIALAFGTLDLMFFIIHIRSRYLTIDDARHRHSVSMQAGRRILPNLRGRDISPGGCTCVIPCQRLCLQMSYYGCGTAWKTEYCGEGDVYTINIETGSQQILMCGIKPSPPTTAIEAMRTVPVPVGHF